jgi:hypothetical protein
MPLAFVAVWMSLIFGFSAGKIVYDPTISKPSKTASISQLDKVYDVAETHINIEK